MDCLTDTSCLASVLEVFNNFAAVIDYCGLVLFGDLWSPIGPGIESGTDAVAHFFHGASFEDQSNCTQHAKLVNKHA